MGVFRGENSTKLRECASGFAQVGGQPHRACKPHFTPHLRKAAFPKPMGADGGMEEGKIKGGKCFFDFSFFPCGEAVKSPPLFSCRCAAFFFLWVG